MKPLDNILLILYSCMHKNDKTAVKNFINVSRNQIHA